MVFNWAKCKLLSIRRISAPLPCFALNGLSLDHIIHLSYLDVWLDSILSWHEHIRQVSQRALHRLRHSHHTTGTLWSLYTIVFHCLVETHVFPTLFYVVLVWCCALLYSSRLASLDRVIRHSAIALFWLLHTMSHVTSYIITEFLPKYHLCRLTYGDVLDLSCPLLMIRNQTIGPLDILCQEIRHLDRHASIHASLLCQFKTHHLWASDPLVMPWPVAPSILDKDTPFSGFMRHAFILPLMAYGYSLTAHLIISCVVLLLCSLLGTLAIVARLLLDSLAIIIALKQNWSHFDSAINMLCG